MIFVNNFYYPLMSICKEISGERQYGLPRTSRFGVILGHPHENSIPETLGISNDQLLGKDRYNATQAVLDTPRTMTTVSRNTNLSRYSTTFSLAEEFTIDAV